MTSYSQLREEIEDLIPDVVFTKQRIAAIMTAVETYLEEKAVAIDKANEGEPVGKYEKGYHYGMVVAARILRSKE